MLSEKYKNFNLLLNNMKALNINEKYYNYDVYYLEEDGDDASSKLLNNLSLIFIKLPEILQNKIHNNELTAIFDNLTMEEDGTNRNYKMLIDIFRETNRYLVLLQQNNFNQTSLVLNNDFKDKNVSFLHELLEFTCWNVDDECYNDLDDYTKNLVIGLNILIINTLETLTQNKQNAQTVNILVNINNCCVVILYILNRFEKIITAD